MTTKRLFLRLTVLTVVSFFIGAVGCSKEQPDGLDPDNPVTITIWHYYNGAQKTAFDVAVSEFNETLGYEKGIIVDSISYGGVEELAENVLAAANEALDAKEIPNIFGTYGDTAYELLKMGKITEIDKYLTADEIEEYEPSFINEGKIGTDKLYIFPIAKSTESILLNKTDFDAFAEGLKSSGMNESAQLDDLLTWEGILRVSDIYYRYTQKQSPDNKGKAFIGLDSLANYLIIGSKQLGQDLVKVEGEKVIKSFDKDIMLKLWETFYDATVTGRFMKTGRFCSDDVKTGDSICFLGATTGSSYFPNEITTKDDITKSIEMIVLPMPVFENGDKVAISQGAGMSVVKSDSNKEYASVIFLKWFTGMERNMKFSLNSGYLPVNKASLNENKLLEAFDNMRTDDIKTENSIKSLRVAIDQLRTYNMYFSDVFEGSREFRSMLPIALLDAAQQDRKTYLQLINDGIDPEQAFDMVNVHGMEEFDKWIAFLNGQ